MKRFAGAVLGIVTLGSIMGCGTPKSPAELESGLQSPDPVERRKSADGLRKGDEVPPEAVAQLCAAADKETNPEALGAELIALGVSGSPDAKPRICKRFGDPDVRMSRWANHAMQAWLTKNEGQKGCTGSDATAAMPTAAPTTTATTAAPPPPPPGQPVQPGGTSTTLTGRSI
ncbi:MAG: HEAT repeat domain-containing protein [Polyangiaceae bacterium]